MASPVYQLIMRSGPTPGKIFEVTKHEIYIGRDINNDIVINDAEVSRKHARLVLQSGGYVLEDLGSTNGTFVNGQRLMGPHVLRPGEMVMLGENVGLAFEGGYDPDATMVAAPPPQTAYQPPQQPAYRTAEQPAPPPPPPPAQTAFTGQVPPGPAEPYYETAGERKKGMSPLLIGGIGCVVIIICLVLALVAFDTLNLWCSGPFRALSPLYQILFGGTCP